MPEPAPYLQPFVVETAPVEPQRVGNLDLYLPAADSAPLVVLVHGGPMPPPIAPPSQWPVFRGYASLLCHHGAAVAMFDHGLVGGEEEAAPEDLRVAIDTARHADGVDADRVALWFFSGGGVLSPPYLSAPPSWLRGISFSYAILADEDPDWDPRAAIHPELSVPLLLTRVGQEVPALAEGQQQFLDRSAELGLPLSIIEVPHGGHAFDAAEATAEGQEAVAEATRWVIRALSSDV